MLREKKGLAFPRHPLGGRWAHLPLAKGAPAPSSTHHMAPVSSTASSVLHPETLGSPSETEVTIFHNSLSEVTPQHLCYFPFRRWDSLGLAAFTVR